MMRLAGTSLVFYRHSVNFVYVILSVATLAPHAVPVRISHMLRETLQSLNDASSGDMTQGDSNELLLVYFSSNLNNICLRTIR